MPTASLIAMPHAPLRLDPALLRRIGRALVRTVRVAGVLGGSLTFAATIWLMLAAPGLLTDGAVHAAPRGRVTAQR